MTLFSVCMYAVDTHEFVRTFMSGLTLEDARYLIEAMPHDFPGFYGGIC